MEQERMAWKSGSTEVERSLGIKIPMFYQKVKGWMGVSTRKNLS